MKLTKIKLAGFKSFVDPTTIDIVGNIVAIVGPNGCGKSNIIDAIRWVLGESSAKQLRGSSMQDVIFNGSESRSSVSRVSVELIFDNSLQKPNSIWSSYDEISIKRILTRQSESTYYINNQIVRKKDITELFLGTGLSAKGYAVIEQGMISRIIESKPEELRYYLEEVAGVSKYRERRKDTVSKLEETRTNILRLKDIHLTIIKQIEELKEQASVAKLYLELKQKSDGLQINLYYTQLEITKNKIDELNNNINSYQSQYQDNNQYLIQLNEELVNFNEQRCQLDNELHIVTDNFNDLRALIAKLEERYKNIIDNEAKQQLDIKEHRDKIDNLLLDINKLNQEHNNCTDILNNNKNLLNNIDIELEQQYLTLDDLTIDYDKISNDKHNINNKINEMKQQQILLAKTLELKNNNLTKIDKNITVHNDNSQIIDIDSINNQLINSQNQLLILNNTLSDIKIGIENKKNQLARLIQQKKKLLGELNQVKIDKSSIKTKIVMFNELLVKHSKNQIQLSDYIDNVQDSKVLWQNITVTTGYELASQLVLDELMKAIYINSVKTLKKIPTNSLTLWLNNQLNSQSSTVILKSNSLANYIKINSSEFYNLYNLLNKYIVCDDINQALLILNDLPDAEYIITKDGIILSHDYIKFGTNITKDNILEYQNKLALLEVEYNNYKIIEQKTEQELKILEQEFDQSELELNSQIELQNNLKHDIYTHNLDNTKLEQQILQNDKYNHFINNELKKLTEDKLSIELEIEQLNNQAFDCDESLCQLFEQDSIINVKYQNIKQQHEDSSFKCKNLESKTDNTKHQIKINEQRLDNIKELLEKNNQQMLSHQTSLDKLKTTVNENNIDNQLKELELNRQNAIIIVDKINLVQAQIKQIDESIRAKQKDINQIQHLQQKITDEINLENLNIEKQKLYLQNYQTRLQEFNLVLSSQNRILELDIEHTEIQITKYKEQIEQLGLVNLKAVEDLNNLELKYLQMSNQLNDMEEAIQKLELVLKQIDVESSKLLKDTFIRVNNAFINYFKLLFGGGSCYLELTNSDILTAGINIFANPLGKKNSLIHLLSGGEKALTAMSLIFAFFSLNPAPFCLLDEVDAPLDDVNTLKLCNLIKELASSTQFIYISHNKLTMELATQMIGVTMQEKGISIIVNVSIKDVKVYAS